MGDGHSDSGRRRSNPEVGLGGKPDLRSADELLAEEVLAGAEPRLRRAFIASFGTERAAEATAEALAWGWEHRDRMAAMSNPVGYLYRVGQSRSRSRRQALLPRPSRSALPDVEPTLIGALQDLPDRQRTVVWLVHACEWTQVEVAAALDISPSAVSTHLARAMSSLRRSLEVEQDV